MAAKRSTYGAFALSALLAAFVAVLAAPDSARPGKDAAVRAALHVQDRANDIAAMEGSIARASALTDITVDHSSEAATLSLALDGSPRYEVTVSDDGLTTTVDLYGTILAGTAAQIAPASGTSIDRIETALASVEPTFVSRVTVTRNLAATPAVAVTERGLDLSWAATDADLSPTLTAAHTLSARYEAELNRAHIALARYDEAALRVHDRLATEQAAIDSHYTDAATVSSYFAEASEAIAAEWASIREGIHAELTAQDAVLALVDTAATDETTLQHLRAGIEKLAATRSSIHTQWALYAESADATLAQAVTHFHQEAQSPELTLAALDAQLDVQRAQSGLVEPTIATDARIVGDAVATALADSAQGTKEAASSLAGALTMAFAKAQLDLQRATEIHLADVAERGEILTLTNDDVTAFVAPNGTDGIITRARPKAMASVGDGTEFVLPATRPVYAAQAEEGAASASPASAPATPAAPATATMSAPVIRGADATGNSMPLDPNDPMNQLVDIDFRDMELSNAVAILARKAGVNVVAGPPLTGTITASLKEVPLRKALEILLQLNDLGMIMDDNIIRIVTFEEAIATHRVTQVVYLDNAKAGDLANTLQGTVAGGLNSDLLSVTANETTNVILISGPPGRVQELVMLAQELDVAEPVLPTFTEAIPLNYADPQEILPVVEALLTQDIGKVEADIRSRHIIVNDVPAVIEEVKRVLLQVDNPVKQVAIHALVVDVVLRDGSEIGTNWLLEIMPDINTRGNTVGDFAGGTIGGTLGNIGTETLNAGILSFGLTNKDYNLEATIAAEVASSNAKILANPSIITAENKEAEIVIAQEFPYQEFRQGLEGPGVASTEFKDIGITMTVLPRVTHDNHVIADISAKQSSISGITDSGIPIEDKREATTSLTVADGQSIFIGGLRNISDRLDTSKIPLLGDIPVLNFMFKNTDVEKINTELMIFMTCHVITGELPELTPAEQAAHDEIGSVPYIPDAQRRMFRDVTHPGEFRDPAWKWRRSK